MTRPSSRTAGSGALFLVGSAAVALVVAGGAAWERAQLSSRGLLEASDRVARLSRERSSGIRMRR
jgi:hypothetical protein